VRQIDIISVSNSSEADAQHGQQAAPLVTNVLRTTKLLKVISNQISTDVAQTSTIFTCAA